METKSIELNEKIKQIAEHLGYTSSRFADYLGISRPVMSHVLASRNKASLDIIQRILSKLPGLGIEWTFDGTELDIDLLTKIAYLGSETAESTIEALPPEKRIIKIMICHTDGTFTDYESGCLSEALIAGEQEKDASGKPIDKIIVFYDDKSLKEFKPS